MTYRLLCILALIVSTTGPALAGSAGASGKATMVWRGDISSARSLITDVAHKWHRSGHARIQLQPFNTVSGIDAVAHGSADIGGSLRGPDARRQVEQPLTFTPVAWDALVMITNRDNPVNSLTLKQVHDIYYGKIKNWKAVGGRDQPIDLYAVASPTDGVEYSMRRLLFGRGNQPVAAPRLYINVRQLEVGITLDPKGLGASTMSGTHDNRKLKMLAIDGVKPTPANVADGSYALYTPVYVVSNPDDPKAAEVQQFISYMQSKPAQKIMRQHELLPYQDGLDLANAQARRMSRIADEVGRITHNGPTAAAGATYASQSASAPTSQRTIAARQRLAEKRRRHKAEQAREAAARKANGGGEGS